MLELHLHTRLPRHEALAALKDALEHAGAWITDYREFSNKSAVINFELDDAPAVVEALRHVPGCVLAPAGSAAGKHTRGTLQLTLLAAGPDEKTPIPAVPG